jgi:2-keto-3-deoxy-L-rhamnonate aldolase RhmA
MSDSTSMSLKEKLRRGQSQFGTFLFLPSPDVAEAVARTGLDFVIIDMEHSPKDWQTVANMVRAAAVAGVTALVRVSSISEEHILHALELGADGIVLPFVESSDDVRRAFNAASYAPLGSRGVCTMTRAATYGIGREQFAETAVRANERVVVLGQIESRRGVDNLEEIVKEPGLDGLIVGRADLATSIGLLGQTGHPDVVQLAADVLSQLQEQRSVPYGLAVYGPDEAAEWAPKGATIFVYGADAGVLVSGFAEAVSRFRTSVSAVE